MKAYNHTEGSLRTSSHIVGGGGEGGWVVKGWGLYGLGGGRKSQ